MARRLYIPKGGGTEFDLFIDPQEFKQADDNTRILEIQELQALSDGTRTDIALQFSYANLAMYDTALQNELWDIQDRVDYYSYSTKVSNVTVADGAWFTPDAVQSFCGETGANVATLSIDGLNSTYWRHSVDETHSLVFELRSYPKKISKIRFRYNGTEPITEQLSNMTVRAAKVLANIDNPANLLESGINITWPIGQGPTWVEHTLATKKNKARFIKLEFETAHSTNTAQIREIEVYVETRDP